MRTRIQFVALRIYNFRCSVGLLVKPYKTVFFVHCPLQGIELLKYYFVQIFVEKNFEVAIPIAIKSIAYLQLRADVC